MLASFLREEFIFLKVKCAIFVSVSNSFLLSQLYSTEKAFHFKNNNYNHKVF